MRIAIVSTGLWDSVQRSLGGEAIPLSADKVHAVLQGAQVSVPVAQAHYAPYLHAMRGMGRSLGLDSFIPQDDWEAPKVMTTFADAPTTLKGFDQLLVIGVARCCWIVNLREPTHAVVAAPTSQSQGGWEHDRDFTCVE